MHTKLALYLVEHKITYDTEYRYTKFAVCNVKIVDLYDLDENLSYNLIKYNNDKETSYWWGSDLKLHEIINYRKKKIHGNCYWWVDEKFKIFKYSNGNIQV